MTLSDLQTASLRSHPLLASLSELQFQRILSSARLETMRPHQFLFSRGQPAKDFFVLLTGQINLTVSSRAGAEKIVSIVSPGESFAEAVMFMEAPTYPVSAVAASTSAVVKLCNAEFLALLKESHETSQRMLAGLSKRLHQRLREIEYLTLESATCRLVRAIESRLVDDDAGATEIKLVESRQELASRLSMKPETLSRILRNLSDCGAIVVKGRSVHVPDRRRLLAVLDGQGPAGGDG